MAGIDGDPFTPSESAHLEGLVREFLATEYGVVKRMLTANRPLLDAIAERLLVDAMVDQETLVALTRRVVGGGMERLRIER